MMGETTPRTSGGPANDIADSSAAAPPLLPTPYANGNRTSRTPASNSAIRDGRSLLAKFRNKKRIDCTASPQAAAAAAAAAAVVLADNGGSSSFPSVATMEANSSANQPAVDSPDMSALRDSVHPTRNLEAALDSTFVNGSKTDEDGDDAGSVDSGGGGSGMHQDTRNQGAANGDIVGPALGGRCSEGGCESSGGAASVATAAAIAAADAGVAAAAIKSSPKPPLSRKDSIGGSEGSPARPTPEVSREAARTSQAVFLSSVLPQDFDFDASPRSGTTTKLPLPRSPPRTPNGRHVVNPAGDSAVSLGNSGRRTAGASVTGIATAADAGGVASSSEPVEISVSDDHALARWASMRRLQEQSRGLGSAADQQLNRALQLCRDLCGSEKSVRPLPFPSVYEIKSGMGGGTLLGDGRASRLDALQSTLYGLEEILSKISSVEKAARGEAEALGGPAVLSSLVGSGGAKRFEPRALEGGERAASAARGWLSSSQLKAFEEEVQARSSLEISALQSERRKLRSKVDMFQRQVQLLKREGPGHSPAAVNGGGARRVSPSGARDEHVIGDFDSPAAERRFADLLGARRGEEHQLQGTLEAELASLRGNLEEKDGLITALRDALRLSANPRTSVALEAPVASVSQFANGAADEEPTAAHVSSPQDDEIAAVTPRSAHGRAAAAEPAAIAPPSNDSTRSGGRGRYHSRSALLMGARGPVAAAEQAAAPRFAAVKQPRAAAPWGESPPDEGTSSRSRRDELRRAGNVRRVALHGNGTGSAAWAGADAAGETSADMGRYTSGGDIAAAADSAAAAPRRSIGAAAAEVAAAGNCSTGAPTSRRVGSGGVGRRRRNANGGGYMNIISQATAVTGSALRNLWDSAWVVGSMVGLDGGGRVESPKNKPLREENSSHAVLIL